VHFFRGENDLAIECFRELERIAGECGDRAHVAMATGNCGVIHSRRGEFGEAARCFDAAEGIHREIGNLRGLASTLGNRGDLHLRAGEAERALECYRAQEEIYVALGDRDGMALSVGSQGLVHWIRRDRAAAVACLEYALSEHRSMEVRPHLTVWLLRSATVLFEIALEGGDLPAYLLEQIKIEVAAEWTNFIVEIARSRAEECLTISREIARKETQFESRVLLARIAGWNADRRAETTALEQMLDQSVDETERAELHYWLWRCTADDVHREAALQGYASLISHMPFHEYRQRHEELLAGTPETAALGVR
jgi:tetratricopeptide (TPR) repeat protein